MKLTEESTKKKKLIKKKVLKKPEAKPEKKVLKKTGAEAEAKPEKKVLKKTGAEAEAKPEKKVLRKTGAEAEAKPVKKVLKKPEVKPDNKVLKNSEAKPEKKVLKKTVLRRKQEAVEAMREKSRAEKVARRRQLLERKKAEKASNTSFTDKVLVSTGIVVIAMAIFTGGVMLNSKKEDSQLEEFAQVGEELSSISEAGQSALFAAADAAYMSLDIKPAQEEDAEGDLQEEDYEAHPENGQEIVLNLTSVEKDLKIKFITKESGKLVTGVPFVASVTTPSGSTEEYVDDDKDGIIYKTGIAAGSYSVSIKDIAEIQDYKYSTSAVTVKVKDKIEYKQIDVKAEIKTEAQVNVAKEDTAVQQAETAPALKDTVEWVASTKTAAGGDGSSGEYEEVDSDDIPDPMKTADAGVRRFTVFEKEGDGTTEDSPADGDEEAEKAEEEAKKKAEEEEKKKAEEEEKKKAEEEKKKAEEEAKKKAEEEEAKKKAEEEAKKKAEEEEAKKKAEEEAKKKAEEEEAKKKAEEEAKAPKVTSVGISGAKDLEVGGSVKLSAKVEGSNLTDSDRGVRWSSSDSGVASVDDSGNVTAKKAGKAEITAVSSKDSSFSAKVTVTVSEAKGKLKLKVEPGDSIKVFTGEKVELKASVSESSGNVSYSFSSESEKYAKVSYDGSKATVKGEKAGETSVTVKAKDSNGEVTTTVKVTIILNPKDDDETPLKDKDGNRLYYKNSVGDYEKACLKDYFERDRFYKLKENVTYVYTGWQTINGNTYFYDKNGKAVTGEQIIQGAKYNFDSNGALKTGSSNGIMGIDVSKWNGSINWAQVASSGVNYAIIRCGYRGSSTGALIQDPKFAANIQGAKAAGIKVGVYFFTQAVTEVEAVEEASMAINLAKSSGLSYPVFIDVESSGGRADGLDRNARTAVVNAFCKTVQSSGLTAGVYANKTWFESKMNVGSLTGYKLWLAQYAAAPTYTASRYDLWQYTSKGTVAGISGKVDMNISYLGY